MITEAARVEEGNEVFKKVALMAGVQSHEQDHDLGMKLTLVKKETGSQARALTEGQLIAKPFRGGEAETVLFCHSRRTKLRAEEDSS